MRTFRLIHAPSEPGVRVLGGAGAAVIRGFTIAMIWGVLIGTYSTIYIATPMLVHFNLHWAGEPVPVPGTA
jgi:preprotein translocase subunit SecF